MAGKEESINLSMTQWNQVQTQLLQLRNDKYELEEDNQKKQKEFANIKDRLGKREEELILLKEMVANSSGQQDELIAARNDVVVLRKENQALLRSLTQVNHQNQGQLEEQQQNLTTLNKQIEDLQIRIKTEQKGRIETKKVVSDLQQQLKSAQDLVQQQQTKIDKISKTANKYEEQLKVLLENEIKLIEKNKKFGK